MMIDIGRQEACRRGDEMSNKYLIHQKSENISFCEKLCFCPCGSLTWLSYKWATGAHLYRPYIAFVCIRGKQSIHRSCRVKALPTCIITGYSTCKHVCVCVLEDLERCVGWDITVNNIRDERINNTASLTDSLQTTCVCVVCVSVCVGVRVCIRQSGVCSVYVSNVLTSGSRAIDDLIKRSHLFFAPLGTSPLSLSAALCSLFCCPLLFSPNLPSSLTFHSSQPPLSFPLLLCFQRPEMDQCFHKNGWCSLFILFAFYMAFWLSSGTYYDLTVMERTDGGWITCCQKWERHSKHKKPGRLTLFVWKTHNVSFLNGVI